jgi:hypothetical protein
MSEVRLTQLFAEIMNYMPTTSTISVIGRMRSGKTTFAKLFADYIQKHYEQQQYDVTRLVFNPEHIYNLQQVEDMIRTLSGDINIVIFDDLSFILTGNSRVSREFFNMITRIAHITESDYNFVFFIGHYAKAISPFLRASNVVVLTTITHPEIPALKELFTLSSLYDYLYYYENNPRRFIFLLRYHTFERIIDFTIDRLAKPKTKREKMEAPFSDLDTKVETLGIR